jgi:hypothetical protein
MKEMYLFDLLLVLGLYSCDSSSMPFCLLNQSNSVLRMEGRQYSERELMELMTYRERCRRLEGLGGIPITERLSSSQITLSNSRYKDFLFITVLS